MLQIIGLWWLFRVDDFPKLSDSPKSVNSSKITPNLTYSVYIHSTLHIMAERDEKQQDKREREKKFAVNHMYFHILIVFLNINTF